MLACTSKGKDIRVAGPDQLRPAAAKLDLVTHAVCLFITAFFCSASPVYAGLGVAAVPHKGGGDATEKLIYQYVQQQAEIDKIIAPGTPDALFKALLDIGRSGQTIDYLILAGHGSRDNPSIEFAQDSLMPDDVNMPWLCQHREEYRVLVRAAEARGRDTSTPQAELDRTERRIQTLLKLPSVMSKNGQVVLLNCSTFATPSGQALVQSLGEHLLSLRGGVIRASRVDINIGDAETLFQYAARWWSGEEQVHSGAIPLEGDWVEIPVAARGRLFSEPYCPEPRLTPQHLLLYEVTTEVLDPDSRQFVKGDTMKTPTSSWRIDRGAFRFASKMDDFELEIYWDQVPAVMRSKEDYPWTVNAARSGPRKAEIVITPAMHISHWRLDLMDHTHGARVGANAYKLSLSNAEKAHEDGTMTVSLSVVGRGADLIDGEVVGGDGRLFVGKAPGEYDAYFLELNCNGLAKIRWTFVPHGSPLR